MSNTKTTVEALRANAEALGKARRPLIQKILLEAADAIERLSCEQSTTRISRDGERQIFEIIHGLQKTWISAPSTGLAVESFEELYGKRREGEGITITVVKSAATVVSATQARTASEWARAESGWIWTEPFW